jgi:sulfur carrier protein
MQIIVNAEPCEIAGATLAEALRELGFASAAIATAVNGSFVPREDRAARPLKDGDRLEVLAPMQGG